LYVDVDVDVVVVVVVSPSLLESGLRTYRLDGVVIRVHAAAIGVFLEQAVKAEVVVVASKSDAIANDMASVVFGFLIAKTNTGRLLRDVT